jgi:hypothetical protein
MSLSSLRVIETILMVTFSVTAAELDLDGVGLTLMMRPGQSLKRLRRFFFEPLPEMVTGSPPWKDLLGETW